MNIWSRARMIAFGAALPAAILLFSGCGDATGPNIPGLEVTLTLSDEVMAVGDTIEIRVVATNPTADDVTFVTNTCVLVVQILDESNTPVVYLPGSCNDIALGHTLSPGESLERIVLFEVMAGIPFQKAGGGRGFEPYPLGPGTYRVIAGVSMDLLNPSDPVELRIEP